MITLITKKINGRKYTIKIDERKNIESLKGQPILYTPKGSIVIYGVDLLQMVRALAISKNQRELLKNISGVWNEKRLRDLIKKNHNYRG